MSVFDPLSSIPCSITAGEAVSWTETLSSYPSASYSVAYKFAGQTPQDGHQTFAIAGAGVGSVYTFTAATALKPGVYDWEKQVTQTAGPTMRVVCTGQLTVKPNLATAPTTTTAQTLLTTIETAIALLAATSNQTVSFNGQSYSKASIQTYLAERTRLQAEVYRENQKRLALSGRARSSVVEIRFAGAGDCR